MALIEFTGNPSLNEIVSSLAARVDKPHDTGLMRELKHIVNYKRSKAIHEWLRKDPSMRYYFIQTFNANLEKAPASECSEFPTNCYILRTECEIPEPLRDGFIKTEFQLFDYVGNVSGYDPYAWFYPENIQYIKYRKFTKNRPKWFFSNRRIYVVTTAPGPTVDLTIDRGDPGYEPTGYIAPGAIRVRGVFEDALNLQSCDVCDDNPDTECVSDDQPYAIPRELLNDIVADILTVELRVGPVPNEEREEKDDLKVDSIQNIQHVSNT